MVKARAKTIVTRDRRNTEDLDELHEGTLKVGEMAWSDVPTQEVWKQYKIKKVNGTMVEIDDGKGDCKEVDIHEHPVLPINPDSADDMTSLHHMNEPGILLNMEQRQHKL